MIKFKELKNFDTFRLPLKSEKDNPVYYIRIEGNVINLTNKRIVYFSPNEQVVKVNLLIKEI